MKKWFIKHYYFFFASVLLTAGIIIFLYFSFFLPKTFSFRGDMLQEYADKIYHQCTSTSFPPSCYAQEVPKLMDSISMEEAFEITKLIQEKDPRYLYCHVGAHYLAAKETAKDPTQWKDVVARCPITMCNNGCPHGALMERFQAENDFLSDKQIGEIKDDLKNVCEPRKKWNPIEVERSMCYHGLGHLSMYITNADLQKSIELCKEFGVKEDGRNYVQTCTEGVFMSVFQPLEPEDFALVEGLTPSKNKISSFCSGYTGEAFDACRREAWVLFREELRDPAGTAKFCSYTEDDIAQKKCYATVMNFITVSLLIEQEGFDELENFCRSLPETKTGFCFAEAARRLIQIDPNYTNKALSVCALAQNINVGKECYRRLAEYGAWSFSPDSKSFLRYCEALPYPWNKKCLEKEI
ncbi:hypothetical protein IIA95_03100 [Patescibacteria group bacterium]|nr:hypothetical protein [Patescibacteria group bacterium]